MSANDYRMIAVTDLVPHPDNPRDDLGDPQKLAELANDIASNGNQMRLRVVPIESGPDAGKYLIVEGHRRTAAAELGNVDELLCWVDPSLDTLDKQIEAMLRENTHREAITQSNEAKAIQTILSCEGMSVKKVAKRLNRSESFIRRRSRLAGIPAAAHHLVDVGQLTLEQSDAFDEFKDDQAAVDRLMQSAQNRYESAHDFDRLVLNLRMRRDAPANRAVTDALIKQHKLTPLTDNQTYSGHFSQIYDKASTDEEHAAAGHAPFIAEGSGKIIWYKKSQNAPGQKTPATDEEKAARRRLKDLQAGLEQDQAIWDEHLRRSLTDAGGGLPLTADEKRIQSGLSSSLLRHHGEYQRVSELLMHKSFSHSAGEAVALHTALGKLRPLQLAMLIAELNKPDSLHRPDSWNPTDYRWREVEGVPRWIRVRQELFNYPPSVFETETMNHFKTQAEIQTAGEDDDEDGDENV